jgi:hypothetical protein
MTAIITLKHLRNLDACEAQCVLFEKHFGDTFNVTVEACLAVAGVVDWNWGAQHLLRAPARRAYEEATAAALRAFQEATATARRAYEATAAARRAFREATATARRAYEEATAAAFATAYIQQEHGA